VCVCVCARISLSLSLSLCLSVRIDSNHHHINRDMGQVHRPVQRPTCVTTTCSPSVPPAENNNTHTLLDMLYCLQTIVVCARNDRHDHIANTVLKALRKPNLNILKHTQIVVRKSKQHTHAHTNKPCTRF